MIFNWSSRHQPSTLFAKSIFHQLRELWYLGPSMTTPSAPACCLPHNAPEGEHLTRVLIWWKVSTALPTLKPFTVASTVVKLSAAANIGPDLSLSLSSESTADTWYTYSVAGSISVSSNRFCVVTNTVSSMPS